MRKDRKTSFLIAFICTLVLLLGAGATTLVAVAEGIDNTVTAQTQSMVKQGDIGYCYVYIDSLESMSSLNVAVYYDTDKIEVISSYNQAGCLLYDSSTGESYVQYSYIFDGNGEDNKNLLFYFEYQVLEEAEIGSTFFDIVVSEAYDSSLNTMEVAGSRCRFKIEERVEAKNSYMWGTRSVTTKIQEEFEVNYYIDSTEVASGAFAIRYDADLCEVTEVTLGNALQNTLVDVNADQPGSIYVSFAGTENSFSFDLISVKFKTIKNVDESTEIKLTVTDLYDLQLNRIECSGYTTTTNIEYDASYMGDAPAMSLNYTYMKEIQMLTVTVSLDKNSHLGAGDFVLKFDTEYFEYATYVKGFEPTFFNINDKNAANGELKFSIISMSDIVSQEVILGVAFRVSEACDGIESRFEIDGSGLADSMTNPIRLNFVDTVATISGLEHSYVHTICTRCGAKQPVYWYWDVSEAGDGSLMANLYKNKSDGTYELEIVGTGYMKDWESPEEVPWYRVYRDDITYLMIGEGVKSLGSNAFYGCEYIEGIAFDAVMMDDLTNKQDVFYNVGFVTEGVTVTIGSHAERVPAYLFANDAANSAYITEIAFEENSSCKSIGAYAFDSQDNIYTILLPETVQTIEEFAFYGCDNLFVGFENNELPNSLGAAWLDATHLYFLNVKEFVWLEEALYAVLNDDTAVMVKYYGTVREYQIPEEVNGASVTKIANRAFMQNTRLKYVGLPITITEIGEYAFYGCNLEQIVIPANVELIGEAAFDNCSYVKEIIYNAINIQDAQMPSNIFGTNTGKSTTGIAVTIGAEVTNIPSMLFMYNNYIVSVVFEEDSKCTSIGDKAFYHCDKLSIITLPDAIEKIDDFAFALCIGLEQITIPENVQFIGTGAFSDCSNMKGIVFNAINMQANTTSPYIFSKAGSNSETVVAVIGAKVTKIPSNLFYGMSNITSVSFEEGSVCTEIGAKAFYGCTELRIVEIPGSVETIKGEAFGSCEIETLYIYSEKIALETSWGEGNLLRTWPTVVIYAGIESLGTYFDDNYTYMEEISYGGKNLVVYSTHEHLWIIEEVLAEVIPCQKDGFARYICDNCGVHKDDIIYRHESEYHEAKEPDCTNVGWKGYETCENCEYSSYEELPATGHSASDWVVDESATCTTDGRKHTECIVCEEILESAVIPQTGHNLSGYEGQEPTCTEIGWNEYEDCADCDYTTYEELPATGHSASDWIVDEDANCTTDGSKHRECTICSEVLGTAIIPMTGHPYDSVVTNPTCTEQGYTTYTCTECGNSYVSDYVVANGHSLSDWIVDIDATCTADGIKHKECLTCQQPSEISKIPMYGHNYEAVATPPTCTNQGYTTHTCTECEDSYKDSYTEVTGHTYGDWTQTESPQCETDGVERRDCSECDHYETRPVEATGHNVSDWIMDSNATCTEEGVKHKECTVCHKILETSKVPMLIHSYKMTVTAPTCTEQGYTTHTCIDCGDCYVDSYTEAAGHTYGDWVQIESPQCETEGTERRDCSECDHYETRPVEATGHNPGEWIVDKEADYETDGSKHKECTVCHKILETSKVPMLSHTYIAEVTKPTCTEQGYTTHICTDCGDSYIDDYVNATGHNYGNWTQTVASQCEITGTERRDCSACDHYETRTVAATGHKSSDWIVDTNATCTTDGSKHKECTVCHKVLETSKVPMLGHSYTSVVAKPTCTEQGYTTHTCTDCGDSYVDDYVNATGHNYGNWIQTVAPQCETEGTERRDCSACDYYETRAVAATGHKSSEWIVDINATCAKDGSKHKECTVCHKVLETSKIDKLNHSYTSVVTKPTCTAQGYTTHTCTGCGDSYVDDYVNATGHNYGNWIQTVAPQCETEGTERRDCSACDYYETRAVAATGHTASEWSVDEAASCTTDGSKHKECTVCHKVLETSKIDKLNHSYTSVVTKPTCTAQGYTTHTCTRCNDSYVDSYVSATSHNYGNWAQTVAPQCETEGTERRDCLACDHYEIRTVAVTGHILEHIGGIDPTCENIGWTEGSRCTVCQKVIEEPREISATGHKAGDWIVDTNATCTKDGSKHKECTVCHKVLETSKIEKLNHSYTSVVTKPTCTAQGYTTYTCSRCNNSYVDSYVSATGHNYGNWTQTVAPKCETTGTERRDCSACDHYETRTVAAAGHKSSDWIVDTDATCTKDGSKHKECTVCHKNLETSKIDKLNHSFPTNKPNTCSLCGYSKVPEVITSPTYSVDKDTISKVTLETTVSTLVGKLNEGSYVKVYNGNKEVTGNTLIGTGMVVKIMDGNTVKSSYTVVVTGDTNGDGKTTVTDMLAAKAHILNKSKLTGAASEAADTSGDNAITITDFIQMKSHILGKSKIEPRSIATMQAVLPKKRSLFVV